MNNYSIFIPFWGKEFYEDFGFRDFLSELITNQKIGKVYEEGTLINKGMNIYFTSKYNIKEIEIKLKEFISKENIYINISFIINKED